MDFRTRTLKKMGDSDDEFSGRRRDKFRRERNDYERRDRPAWEDRLANGFNGNLFRSFCIYVCLFMSVLTEVEEMTGEESGKDRIIRTSTATEHQCDKVLLALEVHRTPSA